MIRLARLTEDNVGDGSSLGIALLPTKADQRLIYSLTKAFSERINASFFVSPETSIPHLTLFQGIFKKRSEVVWRLEAMDAGNITKVQKVLGFSIWAEKIVFLDFVKTNHLQELHDKLFRSLFPLCMGRSADPQSFEGITAGQQESFERTGYPFSGSEYLPHITLMHLAKNVGDRKALVEQSLKEISRHCSFPKTVTFEQFVVYKVERLGALKQLCFEKRLQ